MKTPSSWLLCFLLNLADYWSSFLNIMFGLIVPTWIPIKTLNQRTLCCGKLHSCIWQFNTFTASFWYYVKCLTLEKHSSLVELFNLHLVSFISWQRSKNFEGITMNKFFDLLYVVIAWIKDLPGQHGSRQVGSNLSSTFT